MRLWCVAVLSLCGIAGAASNDWLDVPFVQQVKAGCGPAAIAMVVQYWAREYPELSAAAVDTERINEALPAQSKRGIRGEALKTYLEERGFQAFVFSGEMQDLRAHFAKGRPVVVCFAPNARGGLLHYAVVAGVDDRSVILNDPTRGKLVREDLGSFEAKWKVTGNWAMLAVPRKGQ
jgi:predicted double-glycine peptidase